jgi:sugar-specific transcriptional regulator TrmB
MDLRDLQKIGLTDGEVKLYSALLDLGESTRTELAKISGISPSKIYDVANRLLEKGLISSVKKNKVIHFKAANPKRIRNFLENKEKEIIKEKDLVNEILPQLLMKYSKSENDPSIEVFYGWEGMKTVYWDIADTLKKNEINYVVGASLGQNSKKADFFYNQYFKKVKHKGYKQKIVFNENVKDHLERTEYYEKSSLHEVKYLYNDTFTEFNFYNDTLLIIMLFNNPLIIRIKSKEAANSFKNYFYTIWKQAKS